MKHIQLLTTIFLLVFLAGCQSSEESKKEAMDIEKRASFHYRLGIDALHKGLLPKAFEELLLSEQISPNQPETLDAIAYAWRVRGDNKQAEKYYESAIESNASSATRNNYGSLLIEMGEYERAITQLKIALEDPRYRNQALAFTNLGDAQTGLKKYDDAIKSYRKAHMLAQDWTHPQLREAQTYIQLERPNYAQALYETILRKEPANQQALIGLMQVTEKTGEQKIVRQYLQNFIEKTPDELQKAWAKDELAHLKK